MYCKNFVNHLAEKIIEKNCQCCINLEKNCKRKKNNNNKTNFIYIDERVRNMILRNSFDYVFKEDEDIFLSIAMCYLHENNMEGFFAALEVVELHGRHDNTLISNFCHTLKEHEDCITDTNWRVRQTEQMHEGLPLFRATPLYSSSAPHPSVDFHAPRDMQDSFDVDEDYEEYDDEENKGNKGNGKKEKEVNSLTMKEWLELFYDTYAPELRDKNLELVNPWKSEHFEEFAYDAVDVNGVVDQGFREAVFNDLPGNFRQEREFFFEHEQS